MSKFRELCFQYKIVFNNILIFFFKLKEQLDVFFREAWRCFIIKEN